MFVEHEKRVATEPSREPHESPAITKLSQAIREGIKHLPNGMFLSAKGCGCGLGAALYAVGERRDTYLHSEAFGILRRHFNVPMNAMIEVSSNHFIGKWSREQCADWLESRGY